MKGVQCYSDTMTGLVAVVGWTSGCIHGYEKRER